MKLVSDKGRPEHCSDSVPVSAMLLSQPCWCFCFPAQCGSWASAKHDRGEGAGTRRQPQRGRGERVGGQRLRFHLWTVRESEHRKQRHPHHPELRRCARKAFPFLCPNSNRYSSSRHILLFGRVIHVYCFSKVTNYKNDEESENNLENSTSVDV